VKALLQSLSYVYVGALHLFQRITQKGPVPLNWLLNSFEAINVMAKLLSGPFKLFIDFLQRPNDHVHLKIRTTYSDVIVLQVRVKFVLLYCSACCTIVHCTRVE
jgi:hypothetical protein